MDDHKRQKLFRVFPEISSDQEEELVAVVHKHWIGYVIIWGTGILTILLLLILTVATLWFAANGGITLPPIVQSIAGLVVLVISGLIFLGSVIAHYVYSRSFMLITNENIIEVKQISLFSRRVAHLSMINVEDVTVHKDGILQTVLNYGSLFVQTAGERENFNFTNAPDPHQYRRFIIEAHEEAIANVGKQGNAAVAQIATNNL
jgi:hypothetical protein